MFHVEHRRPRRRRDSHVFHVEHRSHRIRGCLTRPMPGRAQARPRAASGPVATERSRPQPLAMRRPSPPSRSDRRPTPTIETGRRPSGRPAPPRHRRRQPEGRRRQDDHDDQPRRLPGRARPAHADHRPRPAGQRLDRAGHREPRPRDVDVPRAHARGAARELHRADRRQAPVRGAGQPRPGRRRDRAGAGVQPGDPAAPGDRGGPRRLRLRPHRLPAVARPAHRQRPQRGPRGAGADPVRVLRARGPRPAAAQRRSRPAQPQPDAATSARSCA